ncbi:hypothetical protein ACGFZK_18990 [Streptomyces sp. NPDC048257]|uniref:hypothetical protein n=1 Tax=Streptomyces sp. NPDC048257 TaxID=3365526 RepID=UPI00371D9E76
MTENPTAAETAATAAAHIRKLAEATADLRGGCASPAETAAVTGSLLALARHLDDALQHLERHVRRIENGAWAAPDGGQPHSHTRQADHAVQSARAEARNMARALARAVEALGHLKPPP